MEMFKKKKSELVEVEVECCQCWRTICKVQAKPEDVEKFKDGYHMCPSCFIELCELAMKGEKGEKLNNGEKKFIRRAQVKEDQC